jgi:hypothetical protein
MRAASMPFIRGMEISIRMTEGRKALAFSMASNSASDDLVVVNDQYLARHRFS